MKNIPIACRVCQQCDQNNLRTAKLCIACGASLASSAVMINRLGSPSATERASATKAFDSTAMMKPLPYKPKMNSIGLPKTPTTVLDVDSGLASLGFGVQHAMVAPRHVQRRLVVALDGSADFRSIQKAINRAAPGDIVVVKPGVYRESFSLDKPLELVGDGPVNEIVIECSTGTCLNVVTEKTFVRGLCFVSLADDHVKDRSAITVSSGEVVIENCDLMSAGDCFIAHSGKATLRHCRIHESREGSLWRVPRPSLLRSVISFRTMSQVWI